MKFKYLLYIIIPFLFAFSCEQKEDQVIYDYENQLTGEWIWVKSTYNNTASGHPFILTPDSVGFILKQVFLDNGTYYTYKNDLIESSGQFWLETSDQLNSISNPIVRLYSQKEYFINFVDLKIQGDSLYLDNTAGDGTVKLFLRKKPVL